MTIVTTFTHDDNCGTGGGGGGIKKAQSKKQSIKVKASRVRDQT